MSLYLSRILLNFRTRQVINEVTQPYEMHRTLMRAFPKIMTGIETQARVQYGVLFRAESYDRQKVVTVYVQSHIEPDWRYLEELEGYLYENGEGSGYACKDVRPFYRNIQAGQMLSFRLRANPTRRIGTHGDPLKGKRVELRREEDQITWLVRKGQETGRGRTGGFEPLEHTIRVSEAERHTGRKKDGGRGHHTTHFSVLFDGLLQVTEPVDFMNTLVAGIGPGKAFGCGLLSIAPSKYRPGRE